MTTIGDSFAIVAILFGIGFTAWAMILGASILFADKALAARNLAERHPWRSLAIGFGAGVPLTIVTLTMAGINFPPVKLIGVMGLLVIIAFSMFGATGVCLSIASRIRNMEPNISVYASLVRASAVLVIASFFPLVGWFLVAPVLFIISLGVGVQALFARAEAMERL